MTPELLTVAEAAKILRVTRRWVVAWIDRGELRAIEGIGRGRGLRIDRRWLDEFILARERLPNPQAPRPQRTVPSEDGSVVFGSAGAAMRSLRPRR
jgi:excisionase family DNA binding protein